MHQPVNKANGTSESEFRQTELERDLKLREMELETRLREVELRVGLARTGLRGTLTGALVGFIMVLSLAGISAFFEQVQLTGTHLSIIVGIMAVAIVCYGAFVFERSLSIKGSLQDQSFETKTDGGNAKRRSI
jgi:hypothetical protein